MYGLWCAEQGGAWIQKRDNQHERAWDTSQPRWERILETNDLKFIWKAIYWSGKVDICENEKPDNEQFKRHYENLLSPECQDDHVLHLGESVLTLPVIDDAFTVQELDKVVNGVNVDKIYSQVLLRFSRLIGFYISCMFLMSYFQMCITRLSGALAK